MTRRTVVALWVAVILVLASGGVMLAGTFGILGYAAAMLGAERVAVFLFACALAPMLVVGYVGRMVHDRIGNTRQVNGRLGSVESALDNAAGSIHHARRTLHKHQADKRREYLTNA